MSWKPRSADLRNRDHGDAVRRVVPSYLRRGIAVAVSLSMTLVCAVPSAYAQNAGVANTSASDVTVISNGKVVTDNTVVSAAESLAKQRAAETTGAGNANDATGMNTTDAAGGTSQTGTVGATGAFNGEGTTVFANDNVFDAGNGLTNNVARTVQTNDSTDAADQQSDDKTTGSQQSAGQADGTQSSSTAADAPSAQADAATDTLGGRDFAGQVTKTINGKTYILIGNEQQLRAIGSGKAVVGGIVYMIKQTCSASLACLADGLWSDDSKSTESEFYAGDADLGQNDVLRGTDLDDHDSVKQTGLTTYSRTKYFVKDANGKRVDVSDKTYGNTGLTYTSTANYIIFRDIDLSSANWTPMMFSGTMVGAIATNGEKNGNLFEQIAEDGLGVANADVEKPVISNITVHQTGKLDVTSHTGIGFFGTISNKLNESNPFSTTDLYTATVSNLALNDISVTNESTEVHVDQTLVSALLKGLGDVVGKLLAGLLYTLTLGKVDLFGVIENLLTIRKADPSALATGAFAGRVIGSVNIDRCEANHVTIANATGMTGGFVGYSEGETQYDILSKSLASIITLLTNLLNIIPGLGLGDLITLLLKSGIISLDELIPVGYRNPTISNSSVTDFAEGTVIGNDGNDYAGGFIGVQNGTIIEKSTVSSTDAFSVKARYYAGGFAGVSRNDTVGGLLNDLDIDLLAVLRPQALVQESSVTANGGLTVTAQKSYAGGFTGAMANAYAVNDSVDGTVTVTAQETHAGGFAGIASIGWGLDLGSDTAGDATLVKNLVTAITNLLGTGKLTAANAGTLLSLAGVNPSSVLGTRISGDITVKTVTGSYAGGLIGDGSGVVIGNSNEVNVKNLAFWNSKSTRALPSEQDTKIKGLRSVHAGDSYAGGIAGNLEPTTVAGLLNNVLKVGDLTWLEKTKQFSTFTLADVTLSGVSDGFSVIAGQSYAGGAVGCATGGAVTNVTVADVKEISALGEAGGFVGFTGPGDAVGAQGLNVLDLIKVSGLLSVAEYSSVEVRNSNVAGIASGFTVAATGTADGSKKAYVAGGFYGQANSTRTRESHVRNLKAVVSDTAGVSGGFVGYSTTGGLAEVANEALDEDSSLLEQWTKGGLLSVNDLLGAVPYLIPNYKDTTVSYVNGGYVEGDIAGGFAGNFQSGKVNQFTDDELKDDPTLSDLKTKIEVDGNAAVINLDHVNGGTYAGGFGGKVVSGALASAGNGGISLLGQFGTVDIANLVQVVQGYVPFISYADVRTDANTVEQTSGGKTTDPKNPGLVVSASRLDHDDAESGAAGGYIGYGSGIQVSHCNVTQLRYTKVTEPKQLEGTDGSTYFDEPQSVYVVTAKRYAGGYIGKMDIGSAASVGKGLSLLGDSIKLDNVLNVLSVVVSTIEHSDVTGAASGYSVLASDTSEENANLGNGIATEGSAKNPLGEAGGFAGRVMGGHIQDSNAHNFAYVIGQITAGGYAGGIAPGDVASVLGSDMTILNGLINTGGTFASLLQDFVPTIRNSSTDAVPCGAAVRAQAASDEYMLRGMAGGYVGHDEGGHIWGNNNAPWKSENDSNNHYKGKKRTAYAARIRSVYGAEFAGGFTGFMQAASTAKTGSLSLLFGLISVDNLLGALGVAYPTDENTQVTGPLRNLDSATWQDWVKSVGLNGAYGKEFAELLKHADQITTQDDLDKAFATYVYGTNVVAGRTGYTQNANESQGGVAGGYVGLMRAGTVTNGQAQDTKQVKAMRAAGGFAGAMESGGAVEFGSANVLNIIKLNLSKLVSALNVFVPVVKSSSVIGYRRGMTVEATGTDLTHVNGFAGGYVGYASGAQIWGDKTFDDAKKTDDRWTIGSTHAGYQPTGCHVTNLRRVKGTNAIGGYAGLITAAGVADVNTNASEGILQNLLDALISTPNDLAQVVQATVSTVRGAKATSVKDDQAAAAWGFTVEGAYSVTGADGKTATKYARAAGGFAGSMKAVVAGTEKGGTSDTDTLTVDGLRSVEGGQYAGGFFGQADVTAVASIAGTDGTTGSDQSTELLLKLIKAGNISALEAFRTFIHHANVTGVADGIQIKAHDASQQGILNSKQYTGAAGGFGGGLINGTVDYGTVTNLNSVNGVNYAGGFVGHLGKAGTVNVNNAEVAKLLGATAGVLDIWGSHVDDSSVSGITDGFTVAVSHDGADYKAGTDAATGREVAGGFAGYADLARISCSTVTGLKKVSSGELAGGFVGETTMAYLVNAEISSVLVDIILKIVNALLKLLYVPNLENLGVIDLSQWLPSGVTKLFNLKVLADGDLLYVNLFGLKIGVALSRADAENQQQTDVAIITIGDSTIKLPCTKDGGVDEEKLRSNLTVELIKANRTKVTYSSVQGIADGYDVFGGGATQDSDGDAKLTTGYAGGFIAFNHEGLLEHDDMTYADTIRGTAGLVGPFTGQTKLKSDYSFNSVQKIEGTANTYHIYRDVPSTWSYALTADRQQFTYGSHMDNATKDDGTPSDTSGVLKLDLNRYDVAHMTEKAVIKTFADYQDAVMSNNVGGSNTGSNASGVKNEAKPLGVYVSAAQADLMLGKAVTDNSGGLTPEPDDGQDPCGLDGCQTVNLTLKKVWKDYGRLQRPDSIDLTITATYVNTNGETVTPKTIICYTGSCQAQNRTNPMTVTMSAANGSSWSDTWRAKITGLPVAFKDEAGALHYYTYTVKETQMVYGTAADTQVEYKTPSEAGYSVSVEYGKDADGKYVATVTNSAPLPNTGGSGTQWIAMLAVIILGLGTAWYLRENRVKPASTGGTGTALPFGGRRGRHSR